MFSSPEVSTRKDRTELQIQKQFDNHFQHSSIILYYISDVIVNDVICDEIDKNYYLKQKSLYKINVTVRHTWLVTMVRLQQQQQVTLTTTLFPLTEV